MNTDMRAIQTEIRQKLKDGKQQGETELEIASRLVWMERQKLHALCYAMEEIMGGAAVALDLEREISGKSARLLQWHKPLD